MHTQSSHAQIRVLKAGWGLCFADDCRDSLDFDSASFVFQALAFWLFGVVKVRLCEYLHILDSSLCSLYLQDHLTREVKETFETKYTEQHKIGGRVPVSSPTPATRFSTFYFLQGKGLKYFGCFVMNSCDDFGVDPLFEPISEYR